MTFQRPLIAPIANPVLEDALRSKLARRSETTGSLGELEPLAVQLGLLQNTLKPAFEAPQIVIFAADHGLAVDGVGADAHRVPAGLAQLAGHVAEVAGLAGAARGERLGIEVEDQWTLGEQLAEAALGALLVRCLEVVDDVSDLHIDQHSLGRCGRGARLARKGRRPGLHEACTAIRALRYPRARFEAKGGPRGTHADDPQEGFPPCRARRSCRGP